MASISSAMRFPGDLQQPSATHVRRLTLMLAALFAVAYALFTQDIVSHNTLCRAAMTANLVQNGRVDINGYQGLTTDLAFRDGNHYCDKAPGMSFLAAPVALAFTQVQPVTAETPYSRIWLMFLYLCALTTSGLLSTLAAVSLFRYVLRETKDLDGALVASIAFGLGTPVWGWATSFFSHAATAALLVLGFIAIQEANRQLASDKGAAGFALLGGLALGLATLVEYTSLVSAIIIGVAALITSRWSRPLNLLQTFAFSAIAAMIAIAPALVYHAAAFGSPFATGYAFATVYGGTRTGFFGIAAPRLDILSSLLVSGDRGVIWFAPVILAAAWAVVVMMRRAELRTTAIVIASVFVYYLLLNSGFEYWHGGASTGPRYLTPAIGFSMLALGLAWPHFGVRQRRATLALLALSIFINFATTATDMTAGSLVEKILPSFFSGDLRHTLTYRLFKQPTVLHFALPVIGGCAIGWMILTEWRKLKALFCSRGEVRGVI